MKVGKWWVQSQILTSGNDPANALNGANWPDDYVPMLFMTGDGHRSPPFMWTTRGVWPNFFAQLVKNNMVCCHVEVYADAVTRDSVPEALAQVHTNGKVFGWESNIWKDIEKVLDICIDFIGKLDGGTALAKAKISGMVDLMTSIGNQGYLQHEGQVSMAYTKMLKIMDDPVPATEIFGMKKFLQDYQRAAIRLRTDIHPDVAVRIQRVIDRYPDDFHLITAGGAHLVTNPLYGFLRPPVGTFGVADPHHI